VPAPASEWAEAYKEQARADMNGARLVQGREASVLAMLLQMVLEKLGKAALLRGNKLTIDKARASHAAATRMVQLLGVDRRACERLRWAPSVLKQRVAPLVQQLERAHPQIAAKGPCLEYPWEDSSAKVLWPARHLSVAAMFGPKHPDGLLVFRFADALCREFDAVFQ